MTSLVKLIDDKLYPGVHGNWDDKIFRERLLNRISKDMTVLDLGAGAGIVDHMNFREKAAKVCGVDLDPRVLENPYLDEAKVADAGSIPYEDATFDLVFADNVMEHLDEPKTVFSEISRVLKPGGGVMFKTPNRSHYVPLIARITPHAFHAFVNRLRGRDEEDTFPTHYLANSARQVYELASQTGFEVVDIDLIESRPEYLRMTAVTYLVGAAYERLVNKISVLKRFRVLLIAELCKIGN